MVSCPEELTLSTCMNLGMKPGEGDFRPLEENLDRINIGIRSQSMQPRKSVDLTQAWSPRVRVLERLKLEVGFNLDCTKSHQETETTGTWHPP